MDHPIRHLAIKRLNQMSPAPNFQSKVYQLMVLQCRSKVRQLLLDPFSNLLSGPNVRVKDRSDECDDNDELFIF